MEEDSNSHIHNTFTIKNHFSSIQNHQNYDSNSLNQVKDQRLSLGTVNSATQQTKADS